MFKVNSNTDRLDYGDILIPPAGYSLDAAIGTTYSLDLEALTSIAISLGLSEETDSELMQNPISMLNALQKVSDRILIFCEAGQIKLPSNPSTLCIILEKMIVPVALPFDKGLGRYPAFHPKTWLLVYKNKNGDKLYRFAVLSRNLTFDRSWDISVVLDGKQSATDNEDSKPIADFLEFLLSQVDDDFEDAKEKRTIINNVMREITSVRFQTDSKAFPKFQILPMGIGDKSYDMIKDPLWKDTFHEMFIISPFLSGSVIEHFNDDKMGLAGCKRTLITRKSELDKITGGKADNFDVYIMRDEVVDGEDELSEEGEEIQQQDIHAKLYLRKKSSYMSLYLGSMNASYAAMNKNVEMMIWLKTSNRYLNTEILRNELFGVDTDSNPFKKVALSVEQLKEEDTDELDKMEQKIKEICRAGVKACVFEEDGRYKIRINFDVKGGLENIIISPLYCKKTAPIREEVWFEDLDTLQVSEFYKITVTCEEHSMSRVIMIPTENMPKDRDIEVVQSVVKDKNSFMEYVLFVLNDNHLLSVLEGTEAQKGRAGSKGIEQTFPAVYETMLKTAAEDKDKLNDIDELLKMIKDKDIVPDDFRDMYDTFKQALK